MPNTLIHFQQMALYSLILVLIHEQIHQDIMDS